MTTKERRCGPHGEWLEREGPTVTVGLTKETIDHIGAVGFIDLPNVASSVSCREVAVVIESSKAAIDCEAPLSGRVVATNDRLRSTPALLNEHPEDEGWLYRIEKFDETEWKKLLVVSV